METLRRRLVTVPAVLVAAALGLGLLPLLLVGAGVGDLVRGRARRWALTRLLCFGLAYLVGQVAGLCALFLAGLLPSRAARLSATYAVQRAWVAWLFGAVTRLYRLRFALTGLEAVDPASPGPLLVFMQHTSLVDTLLPTTFLTAARGLRLRWVLKRELLVDPCLDVAGHRLPNAFVARGGADTAGSAARIASLAKDLGATDGVIIYPEGTRFTPARREAALSRLSDPALRDRAARLRRVLPPRPSGPLALLEAAPEADALFLAHVGFEGLATVSAVLSGDLVGRTVRIHAWRVPATDIPRDREGRLSWLWAQWEALDRWVDAEASRRC